jgi:hypothetical protein
LPRDTRKESRQGIRIPRILDVELTGFDSAINKSSIDFHGSR